jgi:hypothetical protein
MIPYSIAMILRSPARRYFDSERAGDVYIRADIDQVRGDDDFGVPTTFGRSGVSGEAGASSAGRRSKTAPVPAVL